MATGICAVEPMRTWEYRGRFFARESGSVSDASRWVSPLPVVLEGKLPNARLVRLAK